MRYTICFWLGMRKNVSLHVAIHTTTENKIGWGNREYDVKMVFSETIGLICMGGNAKKQSIKGKTNELVRGHTLYNPRYTSTRILN